MFNVSRSDIKNTINFNKKIRKMRNNQSNVLSETSGIGIKPLDYILYMEKLPHEVC